jgi:Flp pilus assembly protein TadG
MFTRSIQLKRFRRSVSSKRRGAVMVEMAITSSLLFMFFFAALEFCRVSMIRHSVELALYEGGRRGIVPGATAADVQSTARSVLNRIAVTGATIDVTPSVIQNSTREVSVRIRLPLDRGLFAPAFFFVGKSLDRTLVMQREGSQ